MMRARGARESYSCIGRHFALGRCGVYGRSARAHSRVLCGRCSGEAAEATTAAGSEAPTEDATPPAPISNAIIEPPPVTFKTRGASSALSRAGPSSPPGAPASAPPLRCPAALVAPVASLRWR
jgi:hypothetical protein